MLIQIEAQPTPDGFLVVRREISDAPQTIEQQDALHAALDTFCATFEQVMSDPSAVQP